MKKLSVILIGAGSRGRIYTDVMADMPEHFSVTAVAEPIDSRRTYIKEKHGLSDENCFTDWKPLLAKGKIADVAVIATMDRDHFDPAMAALEAGYDLLLEKPIAPTPEECEKIAAFANEKGKKVVICTVLRYTPLFRDIKDIIDSGRIGDVVSITHEECVGNVHQSHSFVRGNWGNEEKSSCMLLQKSCHDMDILQWLLGKKCKKIQSFGSLTHFVEKNAPEGSPDYCVQGCPAGEKCPYNSIKLYFDDKENDWFRGTCTRESDPTDEMVMKAITETQYGKCVYKCDNNVVDHQTVNMLFDGGVTVTFNMNAFNKGGRRIHVMGTKGELRSALEEDGSITVYDFETKETEEIRMDGKDGINGGHGGGDWGIIDTLYSYLNGTYTGKSVPEISESAENHMMVFAAEESRKNNTVVDFNDYIAKIRR